MRMRVLQLLEISVHKFSTALLKSPDPPKDLTFEMCKDGEAYLHAGVQERKRCESLGVATHCT